jgi:hypothetical protein
MSKHKLTVDGVGYVVSIEPGPGFVMVRCNPKAPRELETELRRYVEGAMRRLAASVS